MIRSLLLAALLVAPATGGAQATQPAARNHALQGNWTMRRLDQGSTALLRIDQVFPGRGVTNVSGSLLLSPGQGCPLTGIVIDDLTAEFRDDPETRRFPISAFVTLRARCGDREYWVEALGLPSGTVLMNGRLTEIIPAGRGFTAVSISR